MNVLRHLRSASVFLMLCALAFCLAPSYASAQATSVSITSMSCYADVTHPTDFHIDVNGVSTSTGASGAYLYCYRKIAQVVYRRQDGSHLTIFPGNLYLVNFIGLPFGTGVSWTASFYDFTDNMKQIRDEGQQAVDAAFPGQGYTASSVRVNYRAVATNAVSGATLSTYEITGFTVNVGP